MKAHFTHFRLKIFCLFLIHFLCDIALLSAIGEDRLSVDRKPTIDFFDELDDKTFYQQKRIHGMKNELNNYSQKLHNLKERFDRIFYGLSAEGNFKTPFNTSDEPKRPVPQTPTSNSISPSYTPKNPVNYSDNNSSLDELKFEEPLELSQPEDQLAFNVDSPGEFTQNDQIVSTFNPKPSPIGGYYLIISPGIAFPYEKHITSKSYRKYDPGFSINTSGGMNISSFKIGLGASYKRHTFHHSAELYNPSRSLSGDSETFAGYLDFGYRLPISTSIDAILGAGIGYYLSIIEDKPDLSSRKDHDVFFTLSSGIAWKYSEYLAASLTYRYLHEYEIPAHILELGLNLAL